MRPAIALLLLACTCGGAAEPESKDDDLTGASVGDLRSAMAACQPKVDACLTGLLTEHPDLSGRLSVRVVIDAGKVTKTEIVTDRTGVPAAAACATEIIPKCSFPPGLSDSVTLPIPVPPRGVTPLAPAGQ